MSTNTQKPEALRLAEERKAFEAWRNDYFGPLHTNGESISMWTAWQARAELDRLRQAQGGEADNWRQYAKDGENAQQCIERHRKEHDALLTLLKNASRPYSDNEELKL
jgi:hypothetical protein